MKNINIQDIEQVHVTARRWFQKSYGNTYHSCVVSVLLKGAQSWETIGSVDFEYGYGQQYDQTALQIFKKAGINGGTMKDSVLWVERNGVDIYVDLEDTRNNFYLGRLCRDLKIKYSEGVQDVARKKDL